MSIDFKAALKKPWVKYSLIGIGVLGVAWIFMSRNGSSSTSTGVTGSSGPTDAQVAAQASVANTSATLAAQSAAQQNTLSAQLDALKEQDSHSLALAGIQLTGLQAELAEKSHESDNALNATNHTTDANLNANNTNANAAKAVGVSANQSKTVGAVAGVAVAALAAFF